MNESLRLTELLAARICHDLAGPINTLGGVLELARDDPRMMAEAVAEATEAAQSLTRRLRLLRAAWGGQAEPMSVQELGSLSDGLPSHRLRVDLDGLDSAPFAPAAARLVLNVLLLAAGCLPMGGVLALAGSGCRDVVVTIEGPRAAWPPGLAALLADPAMAWAAMPELAPRDMPAAMTALVARDAGLRVSFLMSADAQQAPPLLLALLPG